MMINKYIELHEKFMDLLVEYHNQHIYFMNRPSMWTSREMVGIMLDIGRLVKEMKKNNLAMRKEMQKEVKAKKAAKTQKEKNK